MATKLSRVNSGLLVAILLVNGYLVLSPFVPALLFWHTRHDGTVQKLTQKIQHHAATPATTPSSVSPDEELIVPSMGLDQPVYEGKYMTVLRQGLWHLPNTSTPDKGGNTVIIGHRFTYTNPRGIFYSLDKVHVGDTIGLIWHGKTYTYTVSSTTVVSPNDIAVEANTSTPELTLYTCTPLWFPENRLVVVAKLQTENQ